MPERGVRVACVRPAGRARMVHHIEVDTTHAHCVATTTGTRTLAHDGCTWDESADRRRDTETGRFTTAPSDPSGLVSNGRIKYNDIVKLGEINGATIKNLGQGEGLDPCERTGVFAHAWCTA